MDMHAYKKQAVKAACAVDSKEISAENRGCPRRNFSLTCAEQLVEVREMTRRVAVALRIKPAEAGRLVNSLRNLALVVNDLPVVTRSSDPKDNYILALAQAGGAAYVVTGDKSGLPALRTHAQAKIVTAARFMAKCLV